MKATRFYASHDIRVEEVPEPAIEQPTDALVRITLAGICGSDLHLFHHGEDLGLPAGMRTGHELLGTVEAVGSWVERVRPGDRVLASMICDGSCGYCREGLFSSCVSVGAFGFSPLMWHYGGELQGGQAEAVRVPLADGTLVVLPEELAGPERELSVLPLIDVMSTGWHGATTAGVGAGDSVLVIGDGAVGLCAVHAAAGKGADQVVCLGHHRDRLAVASRLGATATIESREAESIANQVLELTSGRGVRVVVVSVSGAEEMAVAQACVSASGTISCIGLDQLVGREPRVDWLDQFLRNITITGGWLPGRRYLPELLGLLMQGRLDPGPVLSHRLPLERAPDGYRMMADRDEGVIKVALAPAG